MTTKATIAKPKAAKPRAGEPTSYTAPHPVYTGGKYYPPGEPFVTSDPKGAEWEFLDPAAKAAAEAADPLNHADLDLDALDDDALKAYAVSKEINLGEVTDRGAIITVIKAWHDSSR